MVIRELFDQGRSHKQGSRFACLWLLGSCLITEDHISRVVRYMEFHGFWASLILVFGRDFWLGKVKNRRGKTGTAFC